MEEKTLSKDHFIILRISQNQKKKWKQFSKEKGVSLTSLIQSAVENKMLSSEERNILKFIEKQDNIFSKIENNINQFARVANTKKSVTTHLMNDFLQKLEEIKILKTEQNKIIKQIYKLIGNDS